MRLSVFVTRSATHIRPSTASRHALVRPALEHGRVIRDLRDGI